MNDDHLLRERAERAEAEQAALKANVEGLAEMCGVYDRELAKARALLERAMNSDWYPCPSPTCEDPDCARTRAFLAGGKP